MSNFLTSGRTELLEALKNDAQIAGRVKTWFEFGAGLQRRYNLEPAACPLLALSPAGGDSLRTANALSDLVQTLRIEVATSGSDAEPCEELVALILERLQACDESCLGLSAQGLTGVEAGTLRWRSVPDRSGARIVWSVSIDVALKWKRA